MLSRSKENLLLEDSDPESRSTFSDSFYYDDEFIKNVALLKQQYRTLDNLSAGLLVGQKTRRTFSLIWMISRARWSISEIIYRIQIKNFTEVKGIIQDNSSKAEMFALFSLILVFLMMFPVLRNAFSLKEIIKNKNIFISSIYHEIAGSTGPSSLPQISWNTSWRRKS